MENMYELIDRRTEKVLENIESFRGTKVEVDAVKLARFFGFEVFELKNMSAFDLASLRVSENGSQKDILVNEYYRPAEKRIGIIECISYYLLYSKGSDQPFDYTRGIKERGKDEYASYFARNLLIPKKSFSAIYDFLSKQFEYDAVVSVFAKAYNIKEEIVAKRIEDMIVSTKCADRTK